MTEDRTPRARVLLWVVTAAFGVAALAGPVGVWWWWGVGFDEAESFGVAKPSTDAAMVTSFWIAVAGLAGLALTGVLAAASRRRTRS
jgi:ABC-type Fe3+ transport system permease subunit